MGLLTSGPDPVYLTQQGRPYRLPGVSNRPMPSIGPAAPRGLLGALQQAVPEGRLSRGLLAVQQALQTKPGPNPIATIGGLLGMDNPLSMIEGPAHAATAFARPGRAILSDPGFLYHATNVENAQDIARSGLRTFRPWHGTDQRVWPDGATERRSYFSPNAAATEAFAPDHGEPVILRVRDNGKAFMRERGTGDVYSRKRIPAGVLEILGEDGTWRKLVDAFGGS